MKRGRRRKAHKYIGLLKKTITWRYLLKVGILAAIYVGAAKLGLSFAYGTEQVTTIWPPTGIALAALLILGLRYWPGIVLGAFLANILTDEPVAVALGIAIGNTLEALTGAYLLSRIVRFDKSFSDFRDLFGLLVLAGVISTVISSTIGTSSLALGGLLSHSYGYTWLVWWVGDMMGALVFAPLILIFAANKFTPLRQRPIEAVLLLLATASLSLLIFTSDAKPVTMFPYLIFPLLIWASLRFMQAGAAVMVCVTAVIAIWGTVAKLGPFTAYSSVETNLILLHTFILVAVVTAMFTAITAHKQQRAEQILKIRNQDLKLTNLRVKNLLTGALRAIDSDSQAQARSKRPTK